MYGEFVRALDGRIGNVSVLCAANHVTFVVVRLGMKCNARPGDGFCPLSKKLENIIPTWVQGGVDYFWQNYVVVKQHPHATPHVSLLGKFIVQRLPRQSPIYLFLKAKQRIGFSNHIEHIFFGLPSLLTFCDKNPFSTLLERKSYWTEEGFEREKERLRCCLLDLSVLSQAFQSVVLELWQKGKKILANRSQPSAKWQSTKPINSQSSLFSLFSRVLRISFQPFILRSITRCIPTLDTNNNFLT